MLIGLSLTILLLFSLFSIMLGAEWGQDVIDADYQSEGIVNGTSTSLDFEGQIFLDIGILNGALIILTVVIALAVLIGIRVFNTGLSETSIKIITTSLLYGSIWISLSLLAYSGIVMIETFGELIYVVLTFMYTLGVIQKFQD